MVRLRAFGTYTMRVADPGKFLTEIVGTDGEFTTDEIEFQIRNVIVTHFSQIIATVGHPGARHGGQHPRPRQDRRTSASRRWSPSTGWTLPAFYIENISLPDEVEAALDKRTATGVAGDLSQVHRVQRRRGDDQGRRQPRRRRRHGAGPRRGHGHGDGRAHGAERPLGRGAGRAPPPQTPPPPPAPGKRWHVAVDGQATGPYSRDELGRMAVGRHGDRRQLVWTPGGPDWQRGRDVGELADLFSAPPPPPPAGLRRTRCELGPAVRRARPEQHRFPCPTCGVGPALRAGHRRS